MVLSENFCSVGSVDSWFLQQFPRDKQVMIPELSVAHLPHSEFGVRWNGDWAFGKAQWRQMGMLTTEGIALIEQPPFREGLRLRLTDTLNGRMVEIDAGPNALFPEDLLREKDGHLIFQGVDIGTAHIHVAYFSEPVYAAL